MVVNPLELARQLTDLYIALQQAAEEAGICDEVCKAMAATACDRAPILCKLLSVGQLFPDDHQHLNESLQGCLHRTVQALNEAVQVMYEYLQHGMVGRMRRAGYTKSKLKLTRQYLNERFDAIDSYVGMSTYLKVRQGLQTVVPVVEAVEGLRRDLQALQHISAGRSAHVRAVAAAAVQRRSQKGQKIDIGDWPRFFLKWLAVSPRGDMFATFAQNDVHVRDTSSSAYLYSFSIDSCSRIMALSWSPDGSLLATAAGKSMVLWKVSKAGAYKHRELTSTRLVLHLAWSPDSNRIAVGQESDSGFARGFEVWRVHSGEKEHHFAAEYVRTAEWSPDGNLLATVWRRRGLQLLSRKKFDHPSDRTAMIEGSKTILCIAFSPDSRKIISGGDDTRAGVFDVDSHAFQRLEPPHEDYVRSIAWSPNGLAIASASADSIFLWNAATLTRTRVITDLGKRWVDMIAWGPCSKLLFSAMSNAESAQVRVYRVDGQL